MVFVFVCVCGRLLAVYECTSVSPAGLAMTVLLLWLSAGQDHGGKGQVRWF